MQQLSDTYKQHKVFSELKDVRKVYDFLSKNCFLFIPMGTRGLCNYASYLYESMGGTLDSCSLLLNNERINDAFAVLRNYFDYVLLDIYTDVLLKDKFKQGEWFVEEFDNWMQKDFRIPKLKAQLKLLSESMFSKKLYNLFPWQTTFKTYREFLDDSVHGNKYVRLMYNCNTIYLEHRERYLDKFLRIAIDLFQLHLSFICYLNPCYLSSSDYRDCLDLNLTPPKGSEKWIAPWAQEALNKYIKPNKMVYDFLKSHVDMEFDKL